MIAASERFPMTAIVSLSTHATHEEGDAECDIPKLKLLMALCFLQKTYPLCKFCYAKLVKKVCFSKYFNFI